MLTLSNMGRVKALTCHDAVSAQEFSPGQFVRVVAWLQHLGIEVQLPTVDQIWGATHGHETEILLRTHRSVLVLGIGHAHCRDLRSLMPF